MNWTGFRIWILSVLLNGVFLAIWAAFEESAIMFLPVAFGAALIGIFVTAPLLVIVMLFVDLAGKLPYSVKARIFWLFILLALVGCGFVCLLQLMLSGKFWNHENDLFNGLMSSISIAIGLTVYSERKSLTRRYQTTEDAFEEDQKDGYPVQKTDMQS